MSGPEKLKIVRIINRFNIGGPMWNVLHLTQGLSNQYETLLLGGNALPSEMVRHFSRKISVFSDVRALFSLYHLLRKEQPILVHTHASKAGALGRLAGILCGTTCLVHTYHGLVFKGYFGKRASKTIMLIERWLARRTHAIVAISEQQKTEIVSEFRIAPPEKVHVIPLGFDLQKFVHSRGAKEMLRKQFGIEEKEIAIAIVGRLTTIKNHDFFIDIAKELHLKNDVTYRFFIVGDGERKAGIQDAIDQHGTSFSTRFTFTSWIESMEHFYPAMDVVCLTSISEGTPVSLIEAQACGIPVVSTAAGGVINTVKHGETGFICPQGGLAEFVEYVHKLSTDKNLWQKMSQNGPTFVLKNFSSEQLVLNMRTLYQQLLTKHAQ
jgi:glycosyltransferase involved in cell wall biosynthesis